MTSGLYFLFLDICEGQVTAIDAVMNDKRLIKLIFNTPQDVTQMIIRTWNMIWYCLFPRTVRPSLK